MTSDNTDKTERYIIIIGIWVMTIVVWGILGWATFFSKELNFWQYTDTIGLKIGLILLYLSAIVPIHFIFYFLWGVFWRIY